MTRFPTSEKIKKEEDRIESKLDDLFISDEESENEKKRRKKKKRKNEEPTLYS